MSSLVVCLLDTQSVVAILSAGLADASAKPRQILLTPRHQTVSSPRGRPITISIEDLKLGAILGKGSFAVVRSSAGLHGSLLEHLLTVLYALKDVVTLCPTMSCTSLMSAGGPATYVLTCQLLCKSQGPWVHGSDVSLHACNYISCHLCMV